MINFANVFNRLETLLLEFFLTREAWRTEFI